MPTLTSAGSCTGSYKYSTDGVYTVNVSLTDDDGNGVYGGNGGGNGPAAPPFVYQYAVVYNPKAGFVTGGGWINSPSNACTGFLSSCTSTTVGRANFGFVSQYKNGASTPTGDTEFQFQAGNMDFHSNVYQWLVVSGGLAQYKGSNGTINGAGNYDFMLTACDAQINGSCNGGSTDTFRIKITDHASGSLVYDNMNGSSDATNGTPTTPTTALQGGAIVIHKQ
jgi:hypothetical protein